MLGGWKLIMIVPPSLLNPIPSPPSEILLTHMKIITSIMRMPDLSVLNRQYDDGVMTSNFKARKSREDLR